MRRFRSPSLLLPRQAYRGSVRTQTPRALPLLYTSFSASSESRPPLHVYISNARCIHRYTHRQISSFRFLYNFPDMFLSRLNGVAADLTPEVKLYHLSFYQLTSRFVIDLKYYFPLLPVSRFLCLFDPRSPVNNCKKYSVYTRPVDNVAAC